MNCHSIHKSFFSGCDIRWQIKRINLGYTLTVNKKHFSTNAYVYGNACVYGDARVFGNARVFGDACVSGDACVFGNACIFGDARISRNAQFSYKADYFYFHGLSPKPRNMTFFKCKDDHIHVYCDCFSGDLTEFETKVKKTHNDSIHAKEYLACIEFVKLHFKEV